MPTEEQTYRASIDDKLDLILQQTTKTNGRVTKLEDFAVEHDKASAVFRARITTVVSITLLLVTSIIAPLVVAWFTKIFFT